MKQKIKHWISSLTLLAFIFTTPVFADDANLTSMVKDLQDQMKQMQKVISQQNDRISQQSSEINQLKRSPKISVAPSGETPAAAPMSDFEFNERLGSSLGGANKWLKDLSFKGDLRLRYEAFDNSEVTDPRNRFRLRLRYGFEKKFSEEMKIGFSMASGENLTDSTSTNQSLDGNFAFKQISIEKAYASYTPNFAKIGPVEKFNITAGKFDNPFEKGSSDIVWDRDVKPEGVYEKANFKLMDNSDLKLSSYFTSGQFVLDEDGTLGGDAELFANQLGLNAVIYTPMFERPVDVLSALSYYSYHNFAKAANAGGGTNVQYSSSPRGNSNVTGAASNLDVADFEIVEIYNEVAFYPNGLPVRPFVDWAVNTKAKSPSGAFGTGDDDAWAFGVKVGGILQKGDWETSYAYKYIGAEAVPGFNDSDFGYNGHSNARGHVFKLGYGLTDKITLNGAIFIVNNLTPETLGGTTITDERYFRSQVDLSWKF
ncbi:MAG: putative porin [Candidatus Omnitrophica bacterium]|nr:putative porin [Candidatus Omnitrophota bacterium]